ncbi:IQ domain-containing protein K [Rhinatrema bivittatum]|uniref:IQ domain-containing protein K n=1 Tax=Rhinatrema bivittatum TaxID=194408 RepID=UPI00112934E9|nr:IQ domain-containing protein K [Rhinatrema bivittatum]
MDRSSLSRPRGSLSQQPRTLWEQICKEYEEELLTVPKVPQPNSKYEKHVSDAKEFYQTQQPLYSHSLAAMIPGFIEPLPILPNPKTCYPREYLETYIFPVLLPALAEMLQEAEKEKCFERKRTKFIACDFLTEWLYNYNPKRKGEAFVDFFSIPFVAESLKKHARPPIPLSLLITEEEAAIIIQSFWRGYRVRCIQDIQELRQWQKQLREVKHINKKVEKFWDLQEAKIRKKNRNMEDKTVQRRSIPTGLRSATPSITEEQLSPDMIQE